MINYTSTSVIRSLYQLNYKIFINLEKVVVIVNRAVPPTYKYPILLICTLGKDSQIELKRTLLYIH